MRGLRLFLSLGLLCVAGCKARNFNSVVQQAAREHATLRIPDTRETWLFTWTFDPRAKAEPRNFLDQGLVGGAQANRNYTEEVEGAQMGYGIYFAGDPVQSYSFGNTLVAVKATRGIDVGFQNSREASVPLIQSPLKGIFYLWGGGSPFVGEYAFVARDAAVLQLDTARSFGGKTPVRFAKKARFVVGENTTWANAVDHFADVMSFLGAIAEGENGRPEGPDAYYPVLIDDAGRLNRAGVMNAIEAEFYHGHPHVLKAYDDLLGPELRSPKLPYCTREMAEANSRARHFKTPCSLSIFQQIRNAMKEWDTSNNPNLIGLAEAAVILKAASYLPESAAPASFLALAAALEEQFDKDGGLARAQEGVEAYRLLNSEFRAWSLQNWRG